LLTIEEVRNWWRKPRNCRTLSPPGRAIRWKLRTSSFSRNSMQRTERDWRSTYSAVALRGRFRSARRRRPPSPAVHLRCRIDQSKTMRPENESREL